MPSTLRKDSTILVIGGGTWGASTALHLARRGYSNVTVLDPYAYPSPISAGNDVNKIVETIDWRPTNTSADNDVDISTHITALSSIGWLEDPLFAPYYHETGYVTAASTREGLDFVEEHEIVGDKSGYRYLEGVEFRQTMRPGVLTGEFEGWKGYWKKSGAGWVHARKAMVSACVEAERLGVVFVSGETEGKVVRLLYENGDGGGDGGIKGDVVGAQTADGKEWHAERVVLTAGPYADALLDFKGQLRPTAWTLCHIKMNEEELELYKDLPVMFNVERGFFMEPDEDRHELKICDEHPGYTNFGPLEQQQQQQQQTQAQQHQQHDHDHNDEPDTVAALPPKNQMPTTTTNPPPTPKKPNPTSTPFPRHAIPLASSHRIRHFLHDTMPQLASRPFSFARICWCADTPGRNFLIATHPSHASLILGVGGSGHGFAHLPSVGAFIVDEMEGVLAERFKEVFRWRPEMAVGRDWRALQGRWGVERRVMDFGEVEDWVEV